MVSEAPLFQGNLSWKYPSPGERLEVHVHLVLLRGPLDKPVEAPEHLTRLHEVFGSDGPMEAAIEGHEALRGMCSGALEGKGGPAE